MPFTHYVPVWAATWNFRDKAICGTYVLPCEQETFHPTCPVCARLIEADEVRMQAERIHARELQEQ